MRIACLKHHPAEGPAAIGDWADERGLLLEVFETFQGNFPEPADYDALISMGGPMSVNDVDTDPYVATSLETVRLFLEEDRALLGICLGAQLLAVAAGGNILEGPEKEIGWYPITRQPCGEGECLGDLPQEMIVFHWHGEQIELPQGATLLATSEICAVQAFRLGHHQVGLQCHLEVDSASMERMITAFSEEVAAGGPHIESPEDMELGLQRWGDDCRGALDVILDNWLASFDGSR